MIIRLALTVGLLVPTGQDLRAQGAAAEEQRAVACATCVVFEVSGDEYPVEAIDTLRRLGARFAVSLRQGLAVPSDGRVGVVLVGLPGSGSADRQIFATRTFITGIRAVRPDIIVVLDNEPFVAAGIASDPLRPYVDAVVGAGESWRRMIGESLTADDLTRHSLTPDVERVVIRVTDVVAGALAEFAARAAASVEVIAPRRLTAAEIIARHQAQRRRQEEAVQSTIASGTTVLTFELPGFVAPVSITADTTIFAKGPQTDIEHRNLLVNGSTLAGGSADTAPSLPLVEPERAATAPLVIALTDAYRYELHGEDRVGGDPVYVVAFEPVTDGPVVRGRAWIDASDFSLRRLQVVQSALRGPIVSSEQVDEFAVFSVRGGTVRLPVETKIFQMYDGAGYRTPVHRTIALSSYDVNPADFDARLASAHASPHVMLRETPQGLRYLLKDASGARQVAANAGERIRAVVFGLFVDPNISEPLPFAGLSYVDLDLFGTGAQVSAFFAGIYGEASWTIPSIGGSKWQIDGRASAIAPRYYDRVFRDGVERYAENIRQRPAHVSSSAVRPLGARFRLRAGYSLDVVGFSRGTSTARAFRTPATEVVHGFVGAIEGERGPWTARLWWSPARRQGWRAWGLPGAFDARRRDFQRYGFGVTRTVKLRPVLVSRVETAWMGGHDLDRFSRYSFDSSDNRLHGYPTASIRYDRAVVARSVTSVGRKGIRVHGFADLALAQDAGYAAVTRGYPGIGAAAEVPGPFRTLWAVEWGYGFSARQPDGRVGTQSWRITGYRMF